MEREEAYDGLYRELSLYETSNESPLFKANKLDLFQKVSALTDAVAFAKLSLSEARYLLRQHIETLRAPAVEAAREQDPASDTGVIKF